MSQDRKTVRVKEAVKETGVSRTKLFALIKDGTLESVKVGRLRLVDRSSLNKLLTPETRAA